MTAERAEKLSVREELFIEKWLASGNGAEAARFAGYSAKTARNKAVDLLKRPRIAKAIEARKSRIVRKFRVTQERVLEEMSIIGFSDLRHYALDANGYLQLADGAPDNAYRAVKKFKRKLRLIAGRDDAPPITEIDVEFELWSKESALGYLGNYLKLFKENRADGGPDDDGLTNEQRSERVLGVLKTAASRRASKKAAAA
jgi:hypothetical protein